MDSPGIQARGRGIEKIDGAVQRPTASGDDSAIDSTVQQQHAQKQGSCILLLLMHMKTHCGTRFAYSLVGWLGFSCVYSNVAFEQLSLCIAGWNTLYAPDERASRAWQRAPTVRTYAW
jgi:hypothetical protein